MPFSEPLYWGLTVIAVVFPLSVSVAGARIEAVAGKVVLKTDNAEPKTIIPRDLPMPLRVGDRVATDKTGRVRIVLDDDSEVSLTHGGEVEIPETKSELNLALLYGRLRVFVNSLSGKKRRDWRMRAGDAVMGVRGTEFIVANNRDRTTLCTFSGTVAVHTAANQNNPKTETLVQSNEGVVIASDGSISLPVTMDRRQMDWWREETIVDRSESTDTVKRTLGSAWSWLGPSAVDVLDPLASYSQYHMLTMNGVLWVRGVHGHLIPDLSGRPGTSAQNTSGRMALNAAVVPTKRYLFYVEGIASTKLGYSNDDQGGIILHEAFGLIKNSKRHSLAAGRQEWHFGDGLIIGRDPWRAVTRTQDGILGTLRFAPARIRIFGASLGDRVDSTDFDDFTAGVYTEFSKLPIDLYGIWVRRNGEANQLKQGIIGERLEASLPGPFFFNEEFAYQFGDIGVEGAPEKRLSAFLAYVDAGAALENGAFSIALKGVYLRASGDANSNDSVSSAFVPLAPDSHRFLGLVNAIPLLRNIERYGVSLAARHPLLGRPLLLNIDVSRFQRVEKGDASAPWVPHEDQRHIGDEIDVQLGFEPTPKLMIQAGYGYLFRGKALGASDANAQLAYLLTQLRL